MRPVRFSRIALFAVSFFLAVSIGTNPVLSKEKKSKKEKKEEKNQAPPIPSNLQEVVVVTANRGETPKPKVGSSVTVITAEEMRRRGYRFVLDALRDVPGMTVLRQGGAGSFTSLFTRGTDSDHTLFLVDGIDISDPSSPNGTPALNHLLVDDVERIEVVRGPQSTLYGSDAIGGVVNVITKRGAGKPAHSISATAGSFRTTEGVFRSNGGFGRTDYSFSATGIDTGSFSARAADAEDDPYRNTSLAGRFGLKLTDDARIDVFARFIDADVEIDAGLNPGEAKELTEQAIVKIEPTWIAADGRWHQKASVWAHRIRRDNRVTGFAFPSDFDGSVSGIDWQSDLLLGGDNTLTTGLEYERQQAAGNVSGFSGFDAEFDNLAFFLQDRFEWGDRFSGSIGVRLDDHSEFGSKATWRLAAVRDWDRSAVRLHGSIGTGFKAPALSELFDTSFGSNNPDLDPEESFGYDLGLTKSWNVGRVSAGATYFYNDIDDLIVAVPDANFFFVNVNIEKVETRGVETYLELVPAPRWRTRLDYTWTDTEAIEAASFGITRGSELLRRPRHQAAGSLSYLLPRDRGQATLAVRFVGERLDLDPVTFSTVTNDGYTVVDLAGSVRLNRTVELQGRIDNLFDEDYQEVLGFSSPERSAFAGVKIDF